MRRWVVIALLVALGIGLGLRCPSLSQRPMHNDEGVNGYKFGQLWQTGSYNYDYNEHHGPTLYYLTAALGRLTRAPGIDGFSEGRLRMLTVLCGAGLILLLPLVVDGLGRRGTIVAGLLTAVSPSMVFYSRYYIHEMLLVLFAFLAMACGWRYWRDRKIGWAILAGVAVGLMDATKETFVLSVAAAAGALALNQVWNRWLDASGLPVKARPINYWHLAAAVAAWVAVAVIFYTSFFTHAAGPWDSIRTYGPWLHRAGGESTHIHPWSFYLERLLFWHPGKGPAWTEAGILVLAVFGASAGFVRRGLGRGNASFIRFLTIYTVLLAGAYTVIGYKTPWCLLNFWHGAILLAGVGAVIMVRSVRNLRGRMAIRVAVLAVCAHLGWEAWALSFPYDADQRNPYVYAHTSRDVLRLVKQVKALAQVAPDGQNTVIKVMAPDSDFWPLPWYLRAFSKTGWWDAVPSEPYAPMMIVSARFQAGLEEKKTHLMVGYFELRPGVFFELYVELELWKRYLDSAKKDDPARTP